ncbi:hypothetical protein WG906_18365 [Pedobacter sp. P351]|uniref:hypothetical protein n=1 Tax=Pedobacter superstes TaxID=3133441 RepID=UPI0030A1AE50
MNSQVILGKERGKIVLIDINTQLKWANETFDNPNDAERFCEQNELELLELFEHYALLPENVQNLLLDFGECEDYDDCKALIEILETVGYTADYGLDAEPYHLTKLLD